MKLAAMEISRKAFAPFGQVLEGLDAGIVRHPYMGEPHSDRVDAQLNMTFMRIALATLPTQIDTLERHPFSTQLFAPLNGTGQLIVVCPSAADGTPDADGLAAYITHGGQAINYRANVWHAPRMAISGSGEFIMLRWDCETDEDTEYVSLDEPVTIIME